MTTSQVLKVKTIMQNWMFKDHYYIMMHIVAPFITKQETDIKKKSKGLGV